MKIYKLSTFILVHLIIWITVSPMLNGLVEDGTLELAYFACIYTLYGMVFKSVVDYISKSN